MPVPRSQPTFGHPQLATARDAAEAAAGKLRSELAEACKERDFALASKQAAADAAAALEREVAGRAQGKRQAGVTLQSATSQLQARAPRISHLAPDHAV